jgi:hypothetical protein
MYTKEQFEKKPGQLFYEILDSQLAEVMIERFERLSVVSCDDFKVMFFTNNYAFGYPELGEKWGTSSYSNLPMTVVPRDEFPDGLVKTAADLKQLFYSGYKQLTSVEELLQFLNHDQEKLEEKYMREAKPSKFNNNQFSGTYTVSGPNRLGEFNVCKLQFRAKRTRRAFGEYCVAERVGNTYRDNSTYIRNFRNGWDSGRMYDGDKRKAKRKFHQQRRALRLLNIKR